MMSQTSDNGWQRPPSSIQKDTGSRLPRKERGMTAAELVVKLRTLADFYEAHPDLPVPYRMADADSFLVFVPNDEPKAVFRSLGTFEKHYGDDGWFEAIKHIEGTWDVKFTIRREQVCERKVVGTRQVAEQIIPETYKPSEIIPAHEEEVVEWDCSPVIGETEQEAKAAQISEVA